LSPKGRCQNTEDFQNDVTKNATRLPSYAPEKSRGTKNRSKPGEKEVDTVGSKHPNPGLKKEEGNSGPQDWGRGGEISGLVTHGGIVNQPAGKQGP